MTNFGRMSFVMAVALIGTAIRASTPVCSSYLPCSFYFERSKHYLRNRRSNLTFSCSGIGRRRSNTLGGRVRSGKISEKLGRVAVGSARLLLLLDEQSLLEQLLAWLVNEQSPATKPSAAPSFPICSCSSCGPPPISEVARAKNKPAADALSMSRKQSYGEGWLDGECYLVKQGVYIGSGILVLITIGSTIGIVIISKRKSPAYEQYKVREESKLNTKL